MTVPPLFLLSLLLGALLAAGSLLLLIVRTTLGVGTASILS